jgi:hypothetical protein
MHPGVIGGSYSLDKNLITLRAGSPEFVDVVHLTKEGLAVFPLKFCPGSVDNYAIFKAEHEYQITMVLVNASPSHPSLKCTFEFNWTGDRDKSDIRLLSVTLPSSTPDRDASLPLRV